MTIASEFYAMLEILGPRATRQGTVGRELHNRIAELEESHAAMRAARLGLTLGQVKVLQELTALQLAHMDLQRRCASLQDALRPAAGDKGAPTVSFGQIKKEFEG